MISRLSGSVFPCQNRHIATNSRADQSRCAPLRAMSRRRWRSYVSPLTTLTDSPWSSTLARLGGAPHVRAGPGDPGGVWGWRAVTASFGAAVLWPRQRWRRGARSCTPGMDLTSFSRSCWSSSYSRSLIPLGLFHTWIVLGGIGQHEGANTTRVRTSPFNLYSLAFAKSIHLYSIYMSSFQTFSCAGSDFSLRGG